MANRGITVFLCDDKHLPSCQLLPINQYCRQRKLLMAQCELGKPLQKQMWQQIVIRKIQNQAQCLRLMGKGSWTELQQLAGKVLSNDSDNREAVAAALYFPALFECNFSRGSELWVRDPAGRNSKKSCRAWAGAVHGPSPQE